MMTYGRTPNQIARIDRVKPKMVICAEGHGAVFEESMKPKSATWYEPRTSEKKKRILRFYRSSLELLQELKQSRRQRINKKLMAKDKLQKRKAKLKKPLPK